MLTIPTAAKFPETPAGKRVIKINIYGNVVGYVSGRRFWEFGECNSTSEADAEAWRAGATLYDALYGRFS